MRRAAFSLLALLVAASAQAANPAEQPIARLQLDWWHARFDAKQDQLAHDHYDVIWFGDSITQQMELADPTHPWLNFKPVWDRFYGARHAINLGFVGDATCHLLWRVENGELRGQHPRLAIVLIGANNFGRLHWSAALSLPGVEAVVDAIEARSPASRILLLGVLPSGRGEWVERNRRALNAGLAGRYRADPRVTFLDAGQVLEKNGEADPGLYADPRANPDAPALHPDAEGMRRLYAAIEPTVARLLAEPPAAR